MKWIGLAVLVLSSYQDNFTITDNVNLVVLNVSVRDRHSGFVTDLNQAAFRVFDDGEERTITHFENVDAPVTVGLVVDNSGSMHSKRSEVVVSGLAFARESNRNDEFFVVNFNNVVTNGLPGNMLFTDNLKTLQDALYYGKATGQTALYDAVSYSLQHLEKAHRDQRTLIVVSDGGDNVSKISLPALINEIESSRATIYTIGLVDPENRDLKPAVLRKMANTSGGQYFQPKTMQEVPTVFAQISREIRHRYTVGFVPDEEHDKRTIRNVKVIAERDGERFICRNRPTYRIPPPSGKL